MTKKPAKLITDPLSMLENNLKHTLNPVNPSSEFVSGMKNRLVSGSMVGLEKNSPVFIYLVLVLGFFIGALLFWIIRRLR